MRARKLSLVAAATAVAATAWMAPASASIPPNICPYPPNNPRISLFTEFVTVKAGQVFSVGGNLTRNGCGLPGGRVGLFTRTVHGNPFTYLTQTVTNAAGGHGFKVARNQTTDFLVVFSGEGNYARAVSRVVHVSVTG